MGDVKVAGISPKLTYSKSSQNKIWLTILRVPVPHFASPIPIAFGIRLIFFCILLKILFSYLAWNQSYLSYLIWTRGVANSIINICFILFGFLKCNIC